MLERRTQRASSALAFVFAVVAAIAGGTRRHVRTHTHALSPSLVTHASDTVPAAPHAIIHSRPCVWSAAVLRLRGGLYRKADCGMSDRVACDPRPSQYQAAQDLIGGFLDAYEPYFPYSPLPTGRNASKPVSRARLRGDWRGPLPSLGGGEEMVTRAGAARRYNFWTSGALPWTQWTEYDFTEHGDLVKSVNLTQRREWDATYGVGGHPGWLGWGGLPLRDYARWLREKRAPTVAAEMEQRERLERDNLGWPLILTDPFAEEDALRPPASALGADAAHQGLQPAEDEDGGGGGGGDGAEEVDFGGAGLENAMQTKLVEQLKSLDWLKGPGELTAAPCSSGKRTSMGRSSWRPDEDDLLIALHRQHGNEWKRIAELLPGRVSCFVGRGGVRLPCGVRVGVRGGGWGWGFGVWVLGDGVKGLWLRGLAKGSRCALLSSCQPRLPMPPSLAVPLAARSHQTRGLNPKSKTLNLEP
jgi:hypothetical protein